MAERSWVEMGASQSNVMSRFVGGGEMGQRVREFDWANNPLGPVETWSSALRGSVEIVLSSSIPLLLIWGPQHIQIYNDSFAPLFAKKHPAALGENFLEFWPLAESSIRGPLERALEGTMTLIEDQLYITDRRGHVEEAYFTYSYSPVRDESATIVGVFVSATETTSKILSSRRTRALLALSSAGLEAQSLDDALRRAAESLKTTDRDVPFALFYRVDAHASTARLAASTGLAAGGPACPTALSLLESDAGWPVAEVVRTGASLQLDDLQARFPGLAVGPEREPIHSARVQPIMPVSDDAGRVNVPVVLVTGFATRLPMNEAYRGFHELLATTLSHVVASALAVEARQQQVEALASIDRAKSVFFSNISHEFRTPLTLLLGPLEDELADRLSPLSDLRRARLEVAHRNALRLLRLVNALLDFSSFDAGHARASFAPTDLAAYTFELTGMFRPAIEAAGLSLTVDCPPLPEPIYVDREMWEKVVFNLLSNAFKHTFQGGIRVSLQHGRSGLVVFEVADTGVGIPAAELPRLFERFHRVRGTRARTHEGSGIGLALVQDVVRLHGGALRASSEEGKGSVFRVILRTGSAHLPADQLATVTARDDASSPSLGHPDRAMAWLPPGAAAGAEPNAPPPKGRARILWVEDNAEMREYVLRLLSQHYDVRVAGDGASAIEAVRRDPPDLVLTDVMMPEASGLDLLRAVRNDPATRHVPVILLSARAGQEAAIDGLEAGADDYLVKPFTARELLARVRSHLSLSQARRDLATELAVQVEQRTSELQRTATELRESEEKFQQLTSAIDEVFWISDATSRRTLYVSPGYDRVWGRSRERLFGQALSWLDAVHPDDRERVAEAAGRIAPYSEVFSQEYRIVRGDGGVRWIRARAFPISDAAGRVFRIAGVAEDITEQKNAEAERRRLEWQLQQSQKLEALGTLTGGIAHDFNNILAAILGNVELARQDIAPNQEARESIEEIAAAGQRAKALVQQLLSFSRPAEPQRTAFQLQPVLEEAVRFMRAALPAGVELHFDAKAALPPIEGDPSGMHQIALNLITNAWHALEGNTGRIDVQLAACRVDSSIQQRAPELRAGPYVRFSVRDTGTGIASDVLNRIFEPFFTTKGPDAGTGLGLSVVHGIVRSHGGAILVDSELGRGSTFHVYLPSGAATPASERAAPSAVSVPMGRGERILFIDDEPVLVRLALSTLARLGYRVEAFEQPGDALAAFRADPGRFDLVITDFNMPQMSGIEVAEQLARIRPGVNIALITGYARPDELERAHAIGIREIILKPISIEELGPIVARLLAEPREQARHRPALN